MLIPSELRRIGRAVPKGKCVQIHVRDALPLPSEHFATGANSARRAHRRRTYAEHRARHEGEAHLLVADRRSHQMDS